ncbi:hypothetical protein HHK36_013783 [Tetracentron sinense]|uniref:Uncharacterized protein n=1 Tax=Tetracentron sinense TaxID=13715 RepID=A0A834Z6Y1_TETSI|nr:hypothetical protein HHK36_013783 [Tetracentron sinense]
MRGRVTMQSIMLQQPGNEPLPANRHTIILMQTSQNRASRTFMDYESVKFASTDQPPQVASSYSDPASSAPCSLGICRLYERKLRDLNPAIGNITYDIADLYNFMDGLTDLSALVLNLVEVGIAARQCHMQANLSAKTIVARDGKQKQKLPKNDRNCT